MPSVGRDAVSVERMARRYIAKYNEPGSKENAYKKMFSAFGDTLTVRLKLEIDGNVKKVLYPATEIACPQTVEKDSVPTEYIYPLRMRKEVQGNRSNSETDLAGRRGNGNKSPIQERKTARL